MGTRVVLLAPYLVLLVLQGCLAVSSDASDASTMPTSAATAAQGRILLQKAKGGRVPAPPKVIVTEDLKRCPRIYLVKKKGKGAEKLADVAKKFRISPSVLTRANTGFFSDAQTPLAVGVPLRVPCIEPKKAQACTNQYIQNWRGATTLVDVAIEYGVPLAQLLRLNPSITSLRLADLPKGTKVNVPSCGLKAAKPPAAIRAVRIPFKKRACPSTHIVRARENAATIAEAYKVPLTDLVAMNAGAMPEATAPLPNGLRVLIPCTTVTGPSPYTKLVQDLQAAAKDPKFDALLQNHALAKRLADNIPKAPAAGRRLQESGLLEVMNQHGRRLHGLGSEIAKAVLKAVLKSAAKKLGIFALKQCAAKCTLGAVKLISFFTKDIILEDQKFDITLVGKEGVIMSNPTKTCVTARTDGRVSMETCQFVPSQLWTFAFPPDAEANRISGPMLIQNSKSKQCLYNGNTAGTQPTLIRMGPCVTVDELGAQVAVQDAIWIVPGTALGDLQNFLPSFIERYQQSMALVAARIQVPPYTPAAPASCFAATALSGYEVLSDGKGSADNCATAAVTRGYKFFFVDAAGTCRATTSANDPPAAAAQDPASCAAGTVGLVTLRQLTENAEGGFDVVGATKCLGVQNSVAAVKPVELQECSEENDAQMWTYQSYTLMEGCLIASQGRGAGVIPPNCPANHQMQSGLCYRNCPSGFNGVGPVCWKNGCPAGFVDHLFTCHAPSVFNADNINRCSCPWFDPCCCALASSFGCKTCPPGTSRFCCTCNRLATTTMKESKPRGAGFVPNACDPRGLNTEFQDGLCYRKCPALTPVGIGPVCYQNSAPLAFPDKCSDIMRAKAGRCPVASGALAAIGISLVLQFAACLLIPFPANLAVCDLPFTPGDFATSVTVNAFFARFPPICPDATADPF